MSNKIITQKAHRISGRCTGHESLPQHFYAGHGLPNCREPIRRWRQLSNSVLHVDRLSTHGVTDAGTNGAY